MKKRLLNLLLLLSFSPLLLAQKAILEGYTFENNNRGYIEGVEIKIKSATSNQIIERATSTPDGKFSVALPKGDYILEASKELFHDFQSPISINKDKEFVKIEMQRKPGYIFDVTMAEKLIKEKEQVDAIEGSKIEVYNNTTQQPVLVLESHPVPNFQVTFERGNHYTIMIRKEGYFTKRLEAYVDIEGCILCFDGVGSVQPGVSDVLTDKNKMGTLLANIELQPIVIDASFELKNIYYDLNSAKLRPEAEKELAALVTLLKDNPGITVEIGSHTDARGKDNYNLKLSEKRAKAVVNYLINRGKIDKSSLRARGYGETQLVNRCKNGVKCGEQQHQQNRRTELKIVDIEESQAFADLSLVEIIQLENLSDEIIEIGADGQIKTPIQGDIPQEILNDIEKNEANYPIKATAEVAVQSPSQKQLESNPNPNTTKPANGQTDQPNKLVDPKEKHTAPPPPKPTPPPASNLSTTPAPSSTNPNVGESIVVTNGEKERKIQSIPSSFTGYLVEILLTNEPVDQDAEILLKHGKVFLEKKENGEYAYLLGEFQKKKDAIIFLNEILLQWYPSAKPVYYRNGARVGYVNIILPKKRGNSPK